MLQLLVSAVLLVLVYIVATPTPVPRSALLQPAEVMDSAAPAHKGLDPRAAQLLLAQLDRGRHLQKTLGAQPRGLAVHVRPPHEDTVLKPRRALARLLDGRTGRTRLEENGPGEVMTDDTEEGEGEHFEGNGPEGAQPPDLMTGEIAEEHEEPSPEEGHEEEEEHEEPPPVAATQPCAGGFEWCQPPDTDERVSWVTTTDKPSPLPPEEINW
jgi:hypothetical protein